MQSRPRPRKVWATPFVAGAGVVLLFVIVTMMTRAQGVPLFSPPELILPEMANIFEQDGAEESAYEQPAPTADTPVLTAVVNILMILVALGLTVMAFFVGRWLVRAIRDWWEDRRHSRRETSAFDVQTAGTPATESAVDAPAMRRGISGALAALSESVMASEAIIAAWIGLEDTAREAGIRRAVTETPAEFTLRLIVRTEEIREPAEVLLRAYERVRFGGLIATEEDRERARIALGQIEDGWR